MRKSSREEVAGKHGWYGECAPAANRNYQSGTFSVGCFRWEPTKRGGLKRSKAIVRVRGIACDPTPVFVVADLICDALDAGAYQGKSSVDAYSWVQPAGKE